MKHEVFDIADGRRVKAVFVLKMPLNFWVDDEPQKSLQPPPSLGLAVIFLLTGSTCKNTVGISVLLTDRTVAIHDLRSAAEVQRPPSSYHGHSGLTSQAHRM